jgi:DNA-binding CsgD family transcriptional regulator
MQLQTEFTKREDEICSLVARGASKKDVAKQLFISEHTVCNHLKSIYGKAGVKALNQLSAWWYWMRRHEISDLCSPIITLFLLCLVCVNEVNNDQRDGRPVRAKVKKSKRNECDGDDDYYQLTIAA